MQKLMFVGIGGFIGASLRYLISIASSKFLGTHLPYGTLIVNSIGGFFIGFLMEISLSSGLISQNMKLFLATGILGGLTTFSTFSFETVNLLDKNLTLGVLNIILNLFLSIGGVIAGKVIAGII